MAFMFRKDIFEQETSFFFKNSFILPKFLQIKYSLPITQEKDFIDEVHARKDMSVRNVTHIDDLALTEMFMRSCFKKCKQFVLEDWVDYSEIDCTMKCALVHKKSFGLLQNAIIEANKL